MQLVVEAKVDQGIPEKLRSAGVNGESTVPAGLPICGFRTAPNARLGLGLSQTNHRTLSLSCGLLARRRARELEQEAAGAED